MRNHPIGKLRPCRHCVQARLHGSVIRDQVFGSEEHENCFGTFRSRQLVASARTQTYFANRVPLILTFGLNEYWSAHLRPTGFAMLS